MKKMMKTITLLAVILMSSVVSVAQDRSKYGATEEEQQLCLESLQIYKEFKKQKLDDALVYKAWQTAYEKCPCTASEQMLSDGSKFIKKQIMASKEDRDRVNVLIDSLMTVYDTRIDCYASNKKYKDGKNACYVSSLKAADMKKLQPKEKELAFSMNEEAVKCLQNQSKATLISNYYVELYDHYKEAEEADQAEWRSRLILEYLDLSEYCDYNIANQEKESNQEKYKTAQGNLDEIFVVVANCEEMVPVLEDMSVANPDDMELKIKALRLMNLKDCTESEFYLNTAIAVCNQSETPVCLYSIGIAYLKKDKKRDALEYLEKAAEMIDTSDSDFEKYNLRAGQVAALLGQSGKTTKYANNILDVNPKSGEAYLLKGDAVAAKGDSCDDGRLGRYCAYWTAADIYARAKSIDPSVAEKANAKIRNVSKGFPTIDPVFAVGEKEGNSFTCPCTGGTTIIRIRK